MYKHMIKNALNLSWICINLESKSHKNHALDEIFLKFVLGREFVILDKLVSLSYDFIFKI